MRQSLKIHLNQTVFQAIAQAGKHLNQPVYVVGGFVRDLLLNRPCKDIDVVTVGDGLALAGQTASLLSQSLQVTTFKNFGTAHFFWNDYDVEFVGARKESYRKDSRKPVVETGTLEDDQNRRDFTINAMAISLNESDFGELVDPFGGIQDLEQGIIRTPLEPAETFSDDPLRMMRAIRFATQLDFHIDETTYRGIEASAQRIDIISAERITEELNKIILSSKPSTGFKLLYNTRILHRIFPELVELQGVEYKDGQGHKDNFYHTLQVLDNVAEQSNNLWLRWAAILHDIAKPATKAFDKKEGWTFHGHEFKGMKMVKPIFRRMRLPLDAKLKYVQKLVQLHLRPIALTKEIVTDSAIRRLIYDAGDDLDDLMTLCKCDITSKNQQKVQRFKRNLELVEQKVKDVEERDRIRNFQPVLGGEEIMEMFDLQPSKEVGILKNALKDAVLDGIIQNNREEAINFVQSKGKELGLVPSAKLT